MKSIKQIITLVIFFPSIIFATQLPNFIIFYWDDLGWADSSVSMMDGEPLSKSDYYQTPALERLASQGVRFSNGYAPTPTCTGSRISIQFGQTSARLQYRNVFDVLSKKQRSEQNGWDKEISMAQVVKDSGNNYITAHFGKGMGVRRMDQAGYDVTDEYNKGCNGNGHGSYIDVEKKIRIPDDNPKRIVDLTRLSVDFVKEHAGKRPFYMMISHYAVHIPFQASPKAIEQARQRWIKMGRPDIDTTDPKYKNSKEYKTWQYAAMIEECDANLGALLDALEEAGELENTYIIVTSDNGGGFARRDEKTKQRFNGPLQEGKRSIFEGGLRVPFVVGGPGIKAGSQCDLPVIQWDLLATLHDLSGNKNPLPDAVDGGSLREVFHKGNKGSVDRKAPGLIFHYPCHYHPPVSVIRIGDYKYMKHLNSGETKLFMVAKDYAETKDLSSSMPEKAAEMERIRAAYIEEVDGGRVDDVYAAFFELMDEFKRRKMVTIQKKLAELEQEKPGDYEEKKIALQKEVEDIELENKFQKEHCRTQMKNHSWYEGSSKSKEYMEYLKKRKSKKPKKNKSTEVKKTS